MLKAPFYSFHFFKIWFYFSQSVYEAERGRAPPQDKNKSFLCQLKSTGDKESEVALVLTQRICQFYGKSTPHLNALSPQTCGDLPPPTSFSFYYYTHWKKIFSYDLLAHATHMAEDCKKWYRNFLGSLLWGWGPSLLYKFNKISLLPSFYGQRNKTEPNQRYQRTPIYVYLGMVRQMTKSFWRVFRRPLFLLFACVGTTAAVCRKKQ